ncbi:hypothetical protein DBR47_20050 [Paucibacter sp. KBW04]|uniref:serine/threonine-protein kinase n=1 Tax=Paucibacter sp. KBW04 TaxID=2153361 RepID=UPI000F55FEBA|nr:serine/threonine-protein kinase [Paucibacter sp. KBW04]RQO55550.1 hypothetical protein DBR47_20050 [Paucibacter sp. KBW04]
MIDPEAWRRLSAWFDEAAALDGAAREQWLQALAEREPEAAAQLRQALATGMEGELLPLEHRAAGRAWARRISASAELESSGSAEGGPPEDLHGQRLGAWRLEAKLGQGGMGEVWLASRADGLFEAKAAIKLLRRDLPAARLAGRFARERAVLARLNHPAVARLLDAGVELQGLAEERAFLVLELVSGQSLASHVRRCCPLVAQRLRLLLQIAEAVDYAHAQLIVHRDLKPSNVLVTVDGAPKLLDFGIAGLLDLDEGAEGSDLTRQTGRGLTLGYAAPEQISGAAVGTAADVFSLGVILFELLSGELPFGHRREGRVAREHAVLHDEPRRLADLIKQDTGQDPRGPGRPSDATRALGDLEAIAAKAMRKDPAQRYGSVRALIDDLQRWQAHVPVSVRRDHWQHRTGLWLRRNALAAGAGALVLLSLSAGLAAATWQWRRAEEAARHSAQVTRYLGDLLASAQPESHGGKWPTVLELLDSSRADLREKFRDDPDTRLGLLQVLTTTYNALNRFDYALPLAEEWVQLATQHLGPQAPGTLLARLEQGHGLQIMGMEGRAIAVLEPLREPLRRHFGERSPQYRDALMMLAACYMHSQRLPEAEQALAQAWALTQKLGPVSALDRADYLNNLQVLRSKQGRPREALQILRESQPFWQSREPAHAMQILVMRRNFLNHQIGLAEFDDIEARSRQLLVDMNRLLGPGSDLALLQYAMLARYFSHTGQYKAAAKEYAALLEQAQAQGVSQNPDVMWRPRAESLLVRSRAQPELERSRWRAEAAQLLSEIEAGGPLLKGNALTAVQALADLALAHEDAALAADLLARVVKVGGEAAPGSRLAQLQGQLARLQGDWPRSLRLLQGRADHFKQLDAPATDYAWAAQLDLAYTQVLMGETAAAQASLALAETRRPKAMPQGHPLDALAGFLRARLLAARADDPAVLAAWGQLRQAQGRTVAGPPALDAQTPSASLGGLFF